MFLACRIATKMLVAVDKPKFSLSKNCLQQKFPNLMAMTKIFGLQMMQSSSKPSVPSFLIIQTTTICCSAKTS